MAGDTENLMLKSAESLLLSVLRYYYCSKNLEIRQLFVIVIYMNLNDIEPYVLRTSLGMLVVQLKFVIEYSLIDSNKRRFFYISVDFHLVGIMNIIISLSI